MILDDPIAGFCLCLRIGGYRLFLIQNNGIEIFNLLDRENPGLVEGRAISQNFGETITLAGPPRTIEAGLKVAY